MNINELKLNRRKPKKKVGRGGKRGTYSGRGNKGQKARSGGKIDPLFEGGRSSLVERMKKLRGFKAINLKKINVNLGDLENNFLDGEVLGVKSLIKKGLVGKIEARRGIKILGDGELTKKVTVEKNILLSKTAKTAIEKAGGNLAS